mmetsp:Transcript_48994/g.91192  ORF Transcript_48994/g.91192 Transcript_48994/m.91192 type:complete len:274 (+) Transcript_48994:662-1483(+)
MDGVGAPWRGTLPSCCSRCRCSWQYGGGAGRHRSARLGNGGPARAGPLVQHAPLAPRGGAQPGSRAPIRARAGARRAALPGHGGRERRPPGAGGRVGTGHGGQALPVAAHHAGGGGARGAHVRHRVRKGRRPPAALRRPRGQQLPYGGCVWPGAAPRRALGVGPGAGCVPVGALPALSGVCGGPAARQRRGAGRGAHGGGLVGVGGARHGGGAVDHLGGGRDVARGAALPPSVRLRGAAHLHLRRAARRHVAGRHDGGGRRMGGRDERALGRY